MAGKSMVAPLFVSGEHSRTEIYVVNAARQEADGTLLLRAADGSVMKTLAFTLAGHSHVMYDAGTIVGTGAPQLGRVELYDRSSFGTALNGQVNLVLEKDGRSEVIDEEMIMPSRFVSAHLQGVASTISEPVWALSNSSLQEEKATVTCMPEGGQKQTVEVSISAGATSLLRGCVPMPESQGSTLASHILDSTGTRGEGRAYAIDVRVDTAYGEMQAFGLAQNAGGAHTVANAINFNDADEFGEPSYTFAGVPLGRVPELSATLSGVLAIANFSNKTESLSVQVDSTHQGLTTKQELQEITLAPYEARTVKIASSYSDDPLQNTVRVHASGSTGSLGAAMFVEDTTSDLSYQVIGKNGADDRNAGMHPWVEDGSSDSYLLLHNAAEVSAEVQISSHCTNSDSLQVIKLAPGGTRSIPLHENPMELLPLARKRSAGEVNWISAYSKPVRGRVIRIDRSNHRIRSFQCAAYQVLCGANPIDGSSSVKSNTSNSWDASGISCTSNEAPNYCEGPESEDYYADVSFSWSGGGMSPDFSSAGQYNATAGSPGTDTLDVNMTDDGGCTASATLSVTVTGQIPSGDRITSNIQNYAMTSSNGCPAKQAGWYRLVNKVVFDQQGNTVAAADQQMDESFTITYNGLYLSSIETNNAPTNAQGGYEDQLSVCSTVCVGGSGTTDATHNYTDVWNGKSYPWHDATVYTCKGVTENGK